MSPLITISSVLLFIAATTIILKSSIKCEKEDWRVESCHIVLHRGKQVTKLVTLDEDNNTAVLYVSDKYGIDRPCNITVTDVYFMKGFVTSYAVVKHSDCKHNTKYIKDFGVLYT